MLTVRKKHILLYILLIFVISGFFIVQNPSTITKLFLFEIKAVQQNVALSITGMECSEEEINISALGEAYPTLNCNKKVISKITNLPAYSKLKLKTTYSIQPGFTDPSSSQVSTVFNYINITLNITLTGTAIIYFNITQINLGLIDANDIRLYRYDASWIELTTTVINPTSDPAEFSATTTSFSRFLIGEKGLKVVIPLREHPGSDSGIGSSRDRNTSIITEIIQTVSGNLYIINNLFPGETELELLDPSLSIVKIILNSKKEAENVEIIIDESRNTKLEKPDRSTYRFITIQMNIPDSFFNKIKILFKVQKIWGRDIKLLKYGNSWQELPTEKISEDEYYEYYLSESPGFGEFAITAEKITSIERIRIISAEKVERIAGVVVEKPTKFEGLLYAVSPLIIIGLTILILLYYLIRSIKKYRDITFTRVYSQIFLLALSIIILIIPLTIESLYWTLLPLSIMIIFTFITFMLISHYSPGILEYITNTIKSLSTKLGAKTYLILLLFVFVISLLLIARSGYFTGYITATVNTKSSLIQIIPIILIILGMGIFYIKRIYQK